MKLSDIRIDIDAVENGAWVNEIPDMGDLELKVRGLDCTAARALLERKARLRAGSVPARLAEQANAVNRENDRSDLLETVVLMDWRNLADDGTPVLYSPEMARRLIRSPEFRPFRLAVIWAGNRVGRAA